MPEGDLVLYQMIRENDSTGVSGTGRVAWVLDWPTEFVTVGWSTSPDYSVATYNSMDAVRRIHGHGGDTKFIEMWRFKNS